MKRLAVTLAALPSLTLAAGPQHFSVTASFQAPAKAGANGAIQVTFVPKDPDVHINEEPPPRLKLDPAQRVLLDKQPPAPKRVPPYDPATAKYLDPALPVSFPVAWAPSAPRGAQTVKATVTYFYCSQREGWCRKGSTDVEVSLTVP